MFLLHSSFASTNFKDPKDPNTDFVKFVTAPVIASSWNTDIYINQKYTTEWRISAQARSVSRTARATLMSPHYFFCHLCSVNTSYDGTMQNLCKVLSSPAPSPSPPQLRPELCQCFSLQVSSLYKTWESRTWANSGFRSWEKSVSLYRQLV